MKLLFDANLSPALVKGLGTEYPTSAHVRDAGRRTASDAAIWNHARANGFAIVSKDTDFRERSFVEGFPPKVIWLDVGNAGTEQIAALLNVSGDASTSLIGRPRPRSSSCPSGPARSNTAALQPTAACVTMSRRG